MQVTINLDPTLSSLEKKKSIRKQLALFALEQSGGNKTRAAKLLGRTTRWIRHVELENNLCVPVPSKIDVNIIKILESGGDPTRYGGYVYADKKLKNRINKIIDSYNRKIN
jgi:hypothetical protein